jgi:hypothetical protein
MQILWDFRFNPLRPTGFLGFGKNYKNKNFSYWVQKQLELWGKALYIRLVQEPRGSLPSPAEFAAHGGKFSVFPGNGFENRGFRTHFDRCPDAAIIFSPNFKWHSILFFSLQFLE